MPLAPRALREPPLRRPLGRSVTPNPSKTRPVWPVGAPLPPGTVFRQQPATDGRSSTVCRFPRLSVSTFPSLALCATQRPPGTHRRARARSCWRPVWSKAAWHHTNYLRGVDTPLWAGPPASRGISATAFRRQPNALGAYFDVSTEGGLSSNLAQSALRAELHAMRGGPDRERHWGHQAPTT